MAIAPAVKPAWWRNVRILRVVAQVLFVIAVVLIARELFLNAQFRMEQQGRELSFDFLDSRAGFDIKESVVSYSPTRDYFRAFFAGVSNAMMVAFVGILLSTLLGLLLGVLRLSPNWLLRKISQVYVEVIRNIPALLQIVFWYVAVFLLLPGIGKGVSLFGLAYVSNRGAAVPSIEGGADFGVWGIFVLIGVALAVVVWRWRTKVNDATGQPHYRWLSAFGTFLFVAFASRLVLGDAFVIDKPELSQFNYEGGIQVSVEFAGILVGLVIYTSAFIAEIVWGSILAVSKGQKEAAEAIGLTPAQQLRLVVLPQALRIGLPAITNQYLNFWKNTSLAFVIGFPEIINVTQTMINQAGHALEIFSMVILTYLTVSLAISLVMNILNRAVALKGAR